MREIEVGAARAWRHRLQPGEGPLCSAAVTGSHRPQAVFHPTAAEEFVTLREIRRVDAGNSDIDLRDLTESPATRVT
jgi:hypothetical protein